jgi:hypothetical protein
MSGARIRDRVIIDGAHGEGGGEILRTALSLSAIPVVAGNYICDVSLACEGGRAGAVMAQRR